MLMVVSCTVYQTYVVTGEVDSVYQKTIYDNELKKECKFTVVLVNDAPSGRSGKRKLWLKNSNDIIKNWEPFIQECDYLVFIENKKKQATNSSELNYWKGDNQFCLEGSLEGDQCISKEQQLFSVKPNRLSGDLIGEINGMLVYINYINYGG